MADRTCCKSPVSLFTNEGGRYDCSVCGLTTEISVRPTADTDIDVLHGTLRFLARKRLELYELWMTAEGEELAQKVIVKLRGAIALHRGEDISFLMSIMECECWFCGYEGRPSDESGWVELSFRGVPGSEPEKPLAPNCHGAPVCPICAAEVSRRLTELPGNRR